MTDAALPIEFEFEVDRWFSSRITVAAFTQDEAEAKVTAALKRTLLPAILERGVEESPEFTWEVRSSHSDNIELLGAKVPDWVRDWVPGAPL